MTRRASREIREVQHDQRGSSSADVNRTCEKRLQEKSMVFAMEHRSNLSFLMFPTGMLDVD